MSFGEPKARVIVAGQFVWPIGFRVLRESGELLCRLVLREFQVRYRQTLLGCAWAVFQPAAAMAIFTLLLGRTGILSSEGLPYSVFSLSALVIWSYFANVLIHGSVTLVDNADLIRETAIPRAFLPLSVVLSKLLDLGIGLVLLALWTMAVHPVRPSLQWLLLPIVMVAGLAFTMGVTLFSTAVCVRYRDMRYAIPFVTQVWFFATPVVYSASAVHENMRPVVLANPVAGWVDCFRAILFAHRALDWWSLGITVALSAAAFVLGSLYFRQVERTFADVI